MRCANSVKIDYRVRDLVVYLFNGLGPRRYLTFRLANVRYFVLNAAQLLDGVADLPSFTSHRRRPVGDRPLVKAAFVPLHCPPQVRL